MSQVQSLDWKTFLSLLKKDYKSDLFYHVFPAIIMVVFSVNPVTDWFDGALDAHEVHFPWISIIRTPISVILILAAILLPFYSKYKAAAAKLHTISEEIRSTISIGLDEAVNRKIERCRSLLDSIKKEGKTFTDAEAFRELTMPIEHIKSLSLTLLSVIREFSGNRKVKLTTILCNNNRMDRFVFHTDYEPKITIEELETRSLAKKCLLSQKGQLIQDMDDETLDRDLKRDYYKGNSNIKSIFCYPLNKTKDVSLILSFSSPDRNVLTKQSTELYNDIIDAFSNRFLLEWYLNQIKER